MVKVINVPVPVIDPALRRPLGIILVEFLPYLEHVLRSGPRLCTRRLLQIKLAQVAQRDILVPVQNSLEIPTLAPDVDVGNRDLEFIQPAEDCGTRVVREMSGNEEQLAVYDTEGKRGREAILRNSYGKLQDPARTSGAPSTP